MSNDITFTVDLARYSDNELYNMLTSGIITRNEYRAEMAARAEADRAAETNADSAMVVAAELADYEWKTMLHRIMFGNK